MGRPNSWRVSLLAVLPMLIAVPAHAAVIEGTVTDAGKQPLPGAMISLRDDARGYYETVYADAKGHYRLTTTQQGDLLMRARNVSFADASRPLHLVSGSTPMVDFALSPLTDAADIADNLPASAHFSKIPFDATGPNSRAAIQMTCTNCHSLGSAYNRVPRLPEEWAPVVARMLAFNVGTPDAAINDLTESRSQKFAAGFTDVPPNHKEMPLFSPEQSSARVIEWAVRGATPLPFGITSSRDGKLYVADNGMDRVLVVDPADTEVRSLPLVPPKDFMEIRIGTEGIAEGPDGKLYFTGPASGTLGVLDPKSSELTLHQIGMRDPGIVRIAPNGVVWWTHFWDDDGTDEHPATGTVGRFDPKTNEVTLIQLPLNAPEDYVVPSVQPYAFGIDIDPNSGDVWYSKLYANKIGRIDPKTFAIQEFTPPQMGPRGLRFDNTGNLWVAFPGSSSIASLDPATMKWQVYPLPTLSPEETDAPYSLAIDPATQDVWVTANQSDQMYRFIQADRRFVTYPMPTHDTWMRDIAFTADGLVCGSSGPLPTINIEGGYPMVLCIDPEGAKK